MYLNKNDKLIINKMHLPHTPSIRTEKIFRESELDKGFILRANEQVARTLRDMIHKSISQEENNKRNLEIFCILPERRSYGYESQVAYNYLEYWLMRRCTLRLWLTCQL